MAGTAGATGATGATSATGAASASGAWRTLAVVSLEQFLGMTLWFSATAVTPLLIEHFEIAPSHAPWLTIAVQAGFVAGTLLSAISNVADLVNARVLMFIGSLVGACAYAAVLTAPSGA